MTTSKTTMPDVVTLATEFAIVIREWLTPDQCREIDGRNAVEPNQIVCHSHDFCDANEAMAEAFSRFNVEAHYITDSALWNEAWSIAKANGFGTPKE